MYCDYNNKYDSSGNIIGPADSINEPISCVFENDEYAIFTLTSEDVSYKTMIYNKLTGAVLQYDGSHQLGDIVDGRSYTVIEVEKKSENGYIDYAVESVITDLGI